jgi:hypothetical protein
VFILNVFYFFFCLTKRNKSQGEKPYPFFLRTKAFAMPPEKSVYRSFSPKPTAHLPTYDKLGKNNASHFT